MKYSLLLLAFLAFFSCKKTEDSKINNVEESQTQTQTKDLREFKVTDSKYINVEELWEPFNKDLEDFSEAIYDQLKHLILEQDIPTLQKHIKEGKLTYEKLTKFYLYRIRKFDRNNDLSLNSVIALNPKVIEEAKQKDIEFKNKMMKRPIFGCPFF